MPASSLTPTSLDGSVGDPSMLPIPTAISSSWLLLIHRYAMKHDHRRCVLFHRLAERRPEGMTGIDSDDAEFPREEFQFFQRESEALVVRMAVDIGVELGGEEIAVDHVAFELGHVDAVGGEAAERLVERGRQVAYPENKSGDQWARALDGPVLLARQHHEARGVVGLVVYILGQDIQAVDFRRQSRCDGGNALV